MDRSRPRPRPKGSSTSNGRGSALSPKPIEISSEAEELPPIASRSTQPLPTSPLQPPAPLIKRPTIELSDSSDSDESRRPPPSKVTKRQQSSTPCPGSLQQPERARSGPSSERSPQGSRNPRPSAVPSPSAKRIRSPPAGAHEIRPKARRVFEDDDFFMRRKPPASRPAARAGLSSSIPSKPAHREESGSDEDGTGSSQSDTEDHGRRKRLQQKNRLSSWARKDSTDQGAKISRGPSIDATGEIARSKSSDVGIQSEMIDSDSPGVVKGEDGVKSSSKGSDKRRKQRLDVELTPPPELSAHHMAFARNVLLRATHRDTALNETLLAEIKGSTADDGKGGNHPSQDADSVVELDPELARLYKGPNADVVRANAAKRRMEEARRLAEQKKAREAAETIELVSGNLSDSSIEFVSAKQIARQSTSPLSAPAATAARDQPPPPPPIDDVERIHIKLRDKAGQELVIYCRGTTKISTLLQEWTRTHGSDNTAARNKKARLVVDGEALDGNDTVEGCDIEADDLIEVAW